MKRSKDESTDSTKRQWPRLSPSEVPSLKGVTLNQGTEAQVIDISRGGILIETDVRLRPQMKIMLKVVTTKGIFKITGLVLRSSITSLKGVPIYQSAIAFDNPLTMLEDLDAKTPEADQPKGSESTVPDIFEANADSTQSWGFSESAKNSDSESAVLTVIAPDGLGEAFKEILQMNDW